MNDIQIAISDKEWKELSKEKREKIKDILVNRYDIELDEILQFEKDIDEMGFDDFDRWTYKNEDEEEEK
ncbi:hypothetical protein KLEB273_gp074 [Bacillus phage vB_BauM_KLEB27-3]|nr:hypothetical protein KLEB273_gp074 [Bacillus phage vB_BauM_KLEB27-3]